MNEDSAVASAQDDAREALEICTSCLDINSPGTAFCWHCGTPLTSYAATAPFESIFAEGDFWRKAVRQAKKKPVRRILIELFLILNDDGVPVPCWASLARTWYFGIVRGQTKNTSNFFFGQVYYLCNAKSVYRHKHA